MGRGQSRLERLGAYLSSAWLMWLGVYIGHGTNNPFTLYHLKVAVVLVAVATGVWAINEWGIRFSLVWTWLKYQGRRGRDWLSGWWKRRRMDAYERDAADDMNSNAFAVALAVVLSEAESLIPDCS